ncbi:Malic enzyme-like protein (modular protein) [Frankia canadensis]|uniref:Malic enzyme-like protein (Modular protein) n=1 Tax=Frankia canadensis TaxID=1836972 RepID=A0A2I2KJU6_9ACTN|nr:Malic enzyme-like protein (modular protein) [Frankia canadensis]SOU53216.1 Malic enzyme-like protein (modular protein) [Frankia canadensis]
MSRPRDDLTRAFTVTIRVPSRALRGVDEVLAMRPGTVARRDHAPGEGHYRRISLAADSSATLAWLVGALRQRLGADLLHIEDPVFAVAASGKLTQSVCAEVAVGDDLSLLDVEADRRVVRYLTTHPTHTDRVTGRPRRVALLSDASAVLDFEPLAAEAALPAVESQAVHLHRATGLEVIPIPVAVRDAADLASAVTMLAPGFAAMVLVHTHVRRIHAMRAALPDEAVPLLDTVDDGLAVATTAAVLTHLRRRDIAPNRARVAVVDPARGGNLAGPLIGAGIRELILYDPVTYGVQPLHSLAAELDLIVDLLGLTMPPDEVAVLRARPETPPPLTSATSAPRPLHALPGLLQAAVTARADRSPSRRGSPPHGCSSSRHPPARSCRRWITPGSPRPSPRPPCTPCPHLTEITARKEHIGTMRPHASENPTGSPGAFPATGISSIAGAFS